MYFETKVFRSSCSFFFFLLLSSSSAQHYLECDSWEENPAQFFCKMCESHLCEQRKSEHGKKKISRNHEIVSLTSNNEDMLDIMSCADHTKKKIECFCNQCSELVCTDCIINLTMVIR